MARRLLMVTVMKKCGQVDQNGQANEGKEILITWYGGKRRSLITIVEGPQVPYGFISFTRGIYHSQNAAVRACMRHGGTHVVHQAATARTEEYWLAGHGFTKE